MRSSIGLSCVLLGLTAGCQELAEKAGVTQEIVFIGSGVELGVEGLNGPTQIPWVFASEDKIGEFGGWPAPLAPARVVAKKGEMLTLELIDPALTPGCGALRGGLPGAELRVTVASTEVLDLREDGPEAVDLPVECSADVANATGQRSSRAVPRDRELRARTEKLIKKLRRRYPTSKQIAPQVHMKIAGQVPWLSRGSELSWRSGAPAGRVGASSLEFGAYGTTDNGDGRKCLRDRLGLWPRKRKGRRKKGEDLSEALIELCVDERHYHVGGEIDDELPQRGAPRPGATGR
jgi:hypothetical protein